MYNRSVLLNTQEVVTNKNVTYKLSVLDKEKVIGLKRNRNREDGSASTTKTGKKYCRGSGIHWQTQRRRIPSSLSGSQPAEAGQSTAQKTTRKDQTGSLRSKKRVCSDPQTTDPLQFLINGYLAFPVRQPIFLLKKLPLDRAALTFFI